MAEQRPIAVLGAGPVGSILAASFVTAGQQVLLVECCEARLAQLHAHGLKVGGRTTFETRNAVLLPSLEELRDRPLAALFLCTKAWSLRTILPALQGVLAAETVIVAFQNGIGLEEELLDYFPRERLARGVVNYAGRVRGGSGEVLMSWFNPPNYLGPLDGHTSPMLVELAAQLSASGLQTEPIAATETAKRVFFKTILNAALSPVCATAGITMAQAMNSREFRADARALVREGLEVAAAVGYRYGTDAEEACMRYLEAGGDHLPSMYVDLKRGTPTEIEYINGKIVKIGRTFGHLDVDRNAYFTSTIITHEIRCGVRKPDEIPDYLTCR